MAAVKITVTMRDDGPDGGRALAVLRSMGRRKGKFVTELIDAWMDDVQEGGSSLRLAAAWGQEAALGCAEGMQPRPKARKAPAWGRRRGAWPQEPPAPAPAPATQDAARHGKRKAGEPAPAAGRTGQKEDAGGIAVNVQGNGGTCPGEPGEDALDADTIRKGLGAFRL